MLLERSRETTRFGIAVFALAALLVNGAYQLHIVLGGSNVDLQWEKGTALFFLVWTPLVPLIVHVARRYEFVRGRRLRAMDVHFFVALGLSALTLALHKLMFCESLQCMLDYTPGAWLARWLVFDYLFYGAIVVSVWILDANAAARQRELRSSEIERELSATELHVVNTQIDPKALIELFAWVRAHIENDPARAERMVLCIAGYLHLTVDAIGAHDWTVGDDVALLSAWLRMESVRRGTDIELDVVDIEPIRAMAIAAPFAQPAVTRKLPPASKRVRVAAVHGEIVISADDQELTRIAVQSAVSEVA